MRIDPEKLAKLTALPDNEMWSEIRRIAQKHGITLPEKCPDAKTMSDIRSATAGGAKINLAEAIRVINTYKKGAK